MYFISFFTTIKIFCNSGKTVLLAHNYILLIQLYVMDNFGDGQENTDCNIKEIKNRNFH